MRKSFTLTKNDMARVIVQALYSMPSLPAANHLKVKRMERNRKDHLQYQHKLALKVIQDGIASGTWPTA